MPRKRINDHHPHMLIGLAEIGHALGVSDQTARRWIRDPDIALPAAQLPTGHYASSTLLISLWLLQRMKPYERKKASSADLRPSNAGGEISTPQ